MVSNEVESIKKIGFDILRFDLGPIRLFNLARPWSFDINVVRFGRPWIVGQFE